MFENISIILLLSWCPYFGFLMLIFFGLIGTKFSYTGHLPLSQHLDAPIFDMFLVMPISYILFILFGVFYLFVGLVFLMYFYVNATFISTIIILIIALVTAPISMLISLLPMLISDDEDWRVRITGHSTIFLILPICAYFMFNTINSKVYGPPSISKAFVVELFKCVF